MQAKRAGLAQAGRRTERPSEAAVLSDGLHCYLRRLREAGALFST